MTTIIKYQALSLSGYSLGVFKTRDEAQRVAGFNGTVRQDISNTTQQKTSREFSWEEGE